MSRSVVQYKYPLASATKYILRYNVGVHNGDKLIEYYDYFINKYKDKNTTSLQYWYKNFQIINPYFDLQEYENVFFNKKYDTIDLNDELLLNLIMFLKESPNNIILNNLYNKYLSNINDNDTTNFTDWVINNKLDLNSNELKCIESLPFSIDLYKSCILRQTKIISYDKLNSIYKSKNSFKDCATVIFVPELNSYLPVIIQYITTFYYNNNNYKLCYVKIYNLENITKNNNYNTINNIQDFYNDDDQNIIKWIPL